MTFFYAAQSPRGFANEIHVYRFATRNERNAWVDEHKDDGDVNAATRGAWAITAREAHAINRGRTKLPWETILYVFG